MVIMKEGNRRFLLYIHHHGLFSCVWRRSQAVWDPQLADLFRCLNLTCIFKNLLTQYNNPDLFFIRISPFVSIVSFLFQKNKIKRKLLLSLTILCSSNCIVMSSNNNKILKNGAFFPDLVTCELRNPNSCFLHLLLFFYLRSLISGLWW